MSEHQIIYVERSNAQEFLDYLRDRARPEDILSALTSVMTGKLNDGFKPSDEQTDLARLGRFFDTLIQVEPLPPKPYSAAELLGVVEHVIATIRQEALDRADDQESADLADSANADADDYEKMAEQLRHDDLTAAFKLYHNMDTYAREWLFCEGGADDARLYAKVQ